MKSRIRALFVFAYLVAASFPTRADESVAPSNSNQSDYFRFEVYGDEFQRADKIYFKFGFNPRIDEETQSKIVDSLRDNNIAFALSLRCDGRIVDYKGSPEDETSDKMKNRAMKRVCVDFDYGFPAYGRLLGENVAESLFGEDSKRVSDASFQIAVRAIRVDTGKTVSESDEMEELAAISNELTLLAVDSARSDNSENDADKRLELALKVFESWTFQEWAWVTRPNVSVKVELLEDVDKFSKSKDAFVRGFFLGRASRVYRFGAEQKHTRDDALEERVKLFENEINARRGERDGVRDFPNEKEIAQTIREERRSRPNEQWEKLYEYYCSFFEISTPKNNYLGGEDVYFKLDFKADVSLEERERILKRFLERVRNSDNLHFTIDLREGETRVRFHDSALMKLFNCRSVSSSLSVEEGFPVYDRVRSEDVVASLRDSLLVSIDGANVRTTDKNAPCEFNFELVLSEDNKAFSPAVESENLTIEPSDVSTFEEERSLFARRDALFSDFKSCLDNSDDGVALRRLEELENSLNDCEEYQRAYFLQRVVRTLHKFMGIDKCPELQKKRAQYEEELGLRWIQY